MFRFRAQIMACTSPRSSRGLEKEVVSALVENGDCYGSDSPFDNQRIVMNTAGWLEL